MKKLFFGFLILISSALNAQKVTSQSGENEWIPASALSNVSSGLTHRYATTYIKSTIYIDNAAVFPVKFEKDQFGLVKVDDQAKVKWEARTNGYVIGACRLDQSILVFYTNEWNDQSYSAVLKTIYALELDAKTGKKIQEKPVFQNSKGVSVDPKIHASPDGQFRSLLVRYSNNKRRNNFDHELLKETQSMELITFGNDLNAVTRPVTSGAVGGMFIGSIMTSASDLFIISQQGDQFTAERYGMNGGSPVSKFSVTAPVHSNAKFDINAHVEYSALQPGKVYAAITCHNQDKKRVSRMFAVDTEAKKIIMQEDLLNKEYGEMLEKVGEASGQGKIKLKGQMDALNVAGLAITATNAYYIRQVQYTSSFGTSSRSSTRYNNDEIVISAFNPQLRNTQNAVIKREYQVFINIGDELGWRIRDNQMELLYNVISGIASVSGQYARINLDNMAIVKKEMLPKQGLAQDNNIQAQNTLWFNNGFVVPYYIGRRSTGTVLHKISL
jgi:hypothetical protein